ncbi:MAG TPA: DUF2784 domain-containing protein [Candidatus Binataceae bacterium]|nr:DUF2784 domain-containing protein [Candidatus Binataceae bacterium]
MQYRLLADVVVAIHALYVGFVVFGLLAILAGRALGWRWIRNPYFRISHLAAIGFVCFESIIGVDCPLTTLENALRLGAGQSGYAGDFIGYWLDRLIFYDLPPRVFTIIYLAFGLLVVLTIWLVPIGIASSESSPTDR